MSLVDRFNLPRELLAVDRPALAVASRTVQLGLVHPDNVPASIAPLLPALASSVPNAPAAAVLALRLPS